ncbi:MAG: MBL fold metallo-hydrolase [Bacteroidales bacterium]|nr:MBL fold metallo-hydrolase [Bacteroidales bacterium]
MKLSAVNISNFKVDGGAMFGVVPKILWNKKYPADKDNLINLSLRSLVVDNGENRILIDNGWGDKQSRKFFRHVHLNGGEGLEGGLAKAGYGLDDITDVVLTHLHADHCGGGVKKSDKGKSYEMVFPNARYWVSRQQWDWAVKPNPREADSFLEENLLPMMGHGKLHMVEKPGKLFEGVSVRFVRGHTPGQMIPVIDYKDTKIVYTADLIPTVAHLPLLWNMSYDLDQLATIEEKKSLLEESLTNDYILFFEHDIYTECCTVKDTIKGIREDRLMKFADI